MPQRLCDSQTPVVELQHHSRDILRNSPPAAPIVTCFQQPCPACGRRLLILIEYLGKRVSCDHCHRTFITRDASQDRGDVVDVGSSMLERAGRLLDLIESQTQSGGCAMCEISQP